MGASPPFRTSPEDSVARAKPVLGAEHLSGKRLVKDVMRAFSSSPLGGTIRTCPDRGGPVRLAPRVFVSNPVGGASGLGGLPPVRGDVAERGDPQARGVLHVVEE